MGFKIKWYCILAQFLYFSISWMQSAEELDYGGPQKYLLIKIVAKSASRDQKYASSANIKQFHFWKLQKNLTWQQIIFSYQKLHYTIHLHNLQRNASFMCWFKCLKWPKCNIFWERLPTLYSDHQGPYIVGLQARGLAPIFRSDLRLGPYISTATVHRFLLLK